MRQPTTIPRLSLPLFYLSKIMLIQADLLLKNSKKTYFFTIKVLSQANPAVRQ